MRILSGIQPNGKLHIGNYFGMMRPALEWAQQGEAFCFIADYHSLTSFNDPSPLRQNILDEAHGGSSAQAGTSSRHCVNQTRRESQSDWRPPIDFEGC